MKEQDVMTAMKTRAGLRGGFSLMELTLVLVILGILGTVVVIAVGPQILRAKQRSTETTLRTVYQQLESYRAEYNVFPPTLASLDLQSKPVDGWERDIYYRLTPGGSRPFILMSFGDDGIPDTEDDIDIWALLERRR
jgi:general secretion pathway protein G